jgi:putative ABC transport system permease protein
MSWISRIANALRPERAAAELDDELRFHLEARVDQLVREGMSRRDAERAARLKFGGALQVRESSREVKSAAWLESAVADFRFGARMLRRSRNASLAAIGSLALAIGACTAAFSLLDALVFRQLPLPEPQQLVRLTRTMPAFMNPGNFPRESDSFTYPQYAALRDAGRDSADLFAFSLAGGFQPAQFDDAGGASENVRSEAISGRGFEILGVRAAAGRLIQADDESNAVAVLSHAFWTRRFGASRSAIGSRVNIGGRSVQIVGVAAREFSGVQPGYLTDLWLPLPPSTDPTRGQTQVWGRLHAGAQAPALAAPLQATITNIVREQLRTNPPRNWGPAQLQQYAEAPLRVRDASRGRDSLFRLHFETPLRILGIICALLLLVACSNVGNLLIARATARQAEMALRVSLGATRRRLMQQMLVESAQMAMAATAIAIGLAAFAGPALAARLGTSEFPAWLDAAMDARTIGFAVAVSLLTALLCGIVPALRASAAAPRAALQRQGRVRPLRWMLAAQVGFCVAVLFLSGLLLLSFRKLIAVDLGFARENVVLLNLAPGARASSAPVLLDAVRRLPGVQAASLSDQRPMGGDTAWIMMPFVRFRGGDAESVRPRAVSVAGGFFGTLGIRWIAGRDFLPEEMAADSPAVVVNQAFVERFLPGRDPLGAEFEELNDNPEPVRHRIIGVAANSRWNNLRETEWPTLYKPLRAVAGGTLLVRTATGAPPPRSEIESAAPGLTVRGSISLASQIDNLLLRERLLATLAGFFSAVALLLAGVGLYGVLHFAMVRRAREIGIRMALGARRGSVVRLVVQEMSTPVAAGIAAGMAGGAGLARYLASQLFGVEPTDFWSIAAPLACIMAAAIAALLPPAIRAAGADPATVLRAE